jgi:hypothetical protein
MRPTAPPVEAKLASTTDEAEAKTQQVIQLTAGLSLFAGNSYGRILGIISGSLGALAALLSIGGNNPWWSLAVFALCVYVVHGLMIFGEDERAARGDVR